MKERIGPNRPMRPLVRPLLASAIAALAAGCVSQGGSGTSVQQASLAEPAVATTKVDAEVQRIFAVAGLDPNDPQKSRSVDRSSMGSVLSVRSGGRKVGMAVARVGRDQIQLQDPEALAKIVPGADADALSKAFAGPIPMSGTVAGARYAFDRKHLALEIEADRQAPSSIASALMASKFVRSDKVGEPIPADVVASIRYGGRAGAVEPEAAAASSLVADLPPPTTAPAAPQAPGFFASLLGSPKPATTTVQVAAAPPPPVEPPPPPAVPQRQSTMGPGLLTPPAPSTYEAGPAQVTVADDSYAMDRSQLRSAPAALGYAAQAQDPYEVPAKPTVKRW